MTGKFELSQVLIAACIAAGVGALGYGITSRSSSGTEPAPVTATSRPAAVVDATEKDASELGTPADYVVATNITVENAPGPDVRNELLFPAVMMAAPGAGTAVVSCANGTLIRASRCLGDTVEAGKALTSIGSLKATIMVSDRRVVQAKVDLARRMLVREKSPFDQSVTPRQVLEAAQTDVDVAKIRAQRAAAVAGAVRVGSDGRSLNIAALIIGCATSITAFTSAHVTLDFELFRVGMSGAVQIEALLTADNLRCVAVDDLATVLVRSNKPVPVAARGLTPGVSVITRMATVILVPTAGSGVQSLLVGEGV